jgi:hypothetical protein
MKKTFFKGQRTGNSVEIKMNTDKLEDLYSALMAGYIARVGILGSKTERKERTATNAEIGLIHEKGSVTRHIPRRSFLEMPLVLKSEGLLAIRDSLWKVFTSGDQTKARLKRAYFDLGLIANNIINVAFTSAGFGTWPPDSARTIKKKGSSAPLIDTGQLRRSITHDVIER